MRFCKMIFFDHTLSKVLLEIPGTIEANITDGEKRCLMKGKEMENIFLLGNFFWLRLFCGNNLSCLVSIERSEVVQDDNTLSLCLLDFIQKMNILMCNMVSRVVAHNALVKKEDIVLLVHALKFFFTENHYCNSDMNYLTKITSLFTLPSYEEKQVGIVQVIEKHKISICNDCVLSHIYSGDVLVSTKAPVKDISLHVFLPENCSYKLEDKVSLHKENRNTVLSIKESIGITKKMRYFGEFDKEKTCSILPLGINIIDNRKKNAEIQNNSPSHTMNLADLIDNMCKDSDGYGNLCENKKKISLKVSIVKNTGNNYKQETLLSGIPFVDQMMSSDELEGDIELVIGVPPGSEDFNIAKTEGTYTILKNGQSVMWTINSHLKEKTLELDFCILLQHIKEVINELKHLKTTQASILNDILHTSFCLKYRVKRNLTSFGIDKTTSEKYASSFVLQKISVVECNVQVGIVNFLQFGCNEFVKSLE